MPRKLSELTPLEYDEVMSEVRALMHSRALKMVFDEMREEYVNQLIQAEVGGLTASTLHASIRVLADVQGMVQSYHNDGLMRARKR